MRFKSLALASAAAAALGVGFATPALAHDNNDSGDNEGGCHVHCVARVLDHNGRAWATVDVDVTPHRITGTLHALRDFTVHQGEDFDIRGHCRPREEREEREPRERETREVPREEVRTGFGGGSSAVNVPLAAGALSIIAGGIGLGGLARKRQSSVRS